MKPVYGIWLRNNFRLQDQPVIQKAIEAARTNDGTIIVFFHLHPYFLKKIHLHHDYFFQTLERFRKDCQEDSIRVHIIYGENEEAFTTLTKEIPSLEAVFHLEDFTPFGRDRDEEVSIFLHSKGIETVALRGSHIHHPEEVLKDDGSPYQVFTPYYRQWAKQTKPSVVETNIKELISRQEDVKAIDGQGEKHFENDVLKRCTMNWNALGESFARERLETFLDEGLINYEEWRDRPDCKGTSRLSPYIKTGTLSVRTIFHTVHDRIESAGKGAETYLKELAWRDFYAMIYSFYPQTKDQEYQEKYRSISWNTDAELLEKWKKGETGFPIVDAGMRQLQSIGWMHNRLRMITASFLTKDYQIDWREGEKYFSEKLIDYDEASNIGGWQWAASVGTDAVPYFRVFNPTRQSERFDKDGRFIKKYVRELAHVPEKYIHEPMKMPKNVQADSQCSIGEDYPEPTVDHGLQRKRAIALFKGENE
ncbi:deoxyribodipyrimidine photolyase [Salipaludibacillus keqinensis]|uniref:Deoxyribodipyrimidine photo-lyase n=1 Tax=Salipaludibacillus keqinensis TaxID=2045207 RepID=A0A323TA12_9BACI|nr:deoxyribodipyrimidine photo-lyase [Salipaludibacillus keqinensis]PYZ92358.1 deoxyribodipyrimidine photolyase [Salipaludibacillus keqinensis]